MSKKKRFGISAALTRGLSETIHVVENNAGIFRHVVLPLSRIELDPDNPRKLALDLMDVQRGIRPDDLDLSRKQAELEKLQELAHTIKSSGVINPIVCYKRGECYRVVAGERRCLASILAGKNDIEARVFNERPKEFELKLIQWIENTAREDLTLYERLENVRDMIEAYQTQHSVTEFKATLLKEISGLSLPQCTYYLAVLKAPEDVQIPIRQGHIRNLDKAAFLANISETELRQRATEACINGASLKVLRQTINDHSPKRAMSKSSKHSQGSLKINLGTVTKTNVIKTIIDCVIKEKTYAHHLPNFTKVNWNDLGQVSNAFRKLVDLLEREAVR